MTESCNRQERRSEVRQRVPANRISWTRENAAKAFTGWVSDVATSNIAFVTPTRDQPTLGEMIELTLDPQSRSPRHRSVRVTRTAPHDRFFSLVACRNEAANPNFTAE